MLFDCRLIVLSLPNGYASGRLGFITEEGLDGTHEADLAIVFLISGCRFWLSASRPLHCGFI